MDNQTIACIRLANQQLLSTNLTTPQEIVSWMGAMQAQDFNMAKWAIGIRLPGCDNKKVEEAFNNGEILRTHILRPTWHFVAPENIRWMLPLTGSKIISSMKSRDRDLGLTEEFCTKGFRILEKALEGNKQLTKEQLTVVFEINKLPINTAQLYHLAMRAELRGMICSGALSKNKQTYALLEERVPTTSTLSREEALAKLAQIYFKSHSPATLQDFMWWSGLSATEAKQGMEAIKAEFVTEKIDSQVYLVSSSSSKDCHLPDSIHLLPAFDEYIIAYRDRKAALQTENHSKAISSNGIFRPTVIHNSQTIGLWKKTTSKNNPVVIDFFPTTGLPKQELTEKSIEAVRTFYNI